MTLLEVSDIHTHYGAIEALKGVSLTVDAGEVVTLIGSNGAGKSHHLAFHLGTHPGQLREDHVRRGGHQARTGARDTHPRNRARPRGPPLLRADDRAREPGPGRSPAARPGNCRRPGSRLRPFPPAQGARPPEGRHDVRRRAADARDRARADGPAEAAAARRAVTRDRPDPGATDLRDHRRDQPLRGRDPLVEQNANRALEAASRGYVLETGRVALASDSASLQNNPEVQKAYLGT